jgi:hypothetical protein
MKGIILSSLDQFNEEVAYEISAETARNEDYLLGDGSNLLFFALC